MPPGGGAERVGVRPGRFAKSAYRLREGVGLRLPGLSLVAVENGVLRGSVCFWPVRLGGHESLFSAPWRWTRERGRGIGIALMQAEIEAARHDAWSAIILIGDEP